jgi:hypothetical protein
MIPGAFLAALIPTVAWPAQSGAADVRHPLPLHDGFYVVADLPCGQADTADMVQIMGDRFESGRELCAITVVSRQGTRVTLAEACQETSAGTKTSGTLTVTVPDDHTIVFGAGDKATRYRYCPIPSLPSLFKDAQEMVPDTPPFKP